MRKDVELHLYAQGGHGFAIKKQGLPSDHWMDRFGDWLQSQGFFRSRICLVLSSIRFSLCLL